MTTLVILFIIVIAGYTSAVCIKTKGIPYSISATYYTLEHKLIFGACMTLAAMFLFPVIWALSTTFAMKLLAIVACAGLLGVGLAPDFKNEWINKVHCTSAAVMLICSQVWIALTPFWWVLMPVWAVYIIYTIWYMIRHVSQTLIIDFIRTRPMFWVEIASLTALITTVIVLTHDYIR